MEHPRHVSDSSDSSAMTASGHAYLIYGMQGLVAQQIEAFKKFPPRQKPASFNLKLVLEQLQSTNSKGH